MEILTSLADQVNAWRPLPWEHTPSIYTHIQTHLMANGDLSEDAATLPDEERLFTPGDLRWVPGGLDGVTAHHSGNRGDHKHVKKLISLVTAIAQQDSFSKKIALYKLLLKDDLIEYIDPVLTGLAELHLPPEPYFHKFARWLAKETPDRGPAKFAIALLGLLREPEDEELVMLLGRHDEFTLYAIVAICNMIKDPIPVLWELAKHVHGWGRIHVVERLAGTKNPDIQAWLLREGYKNTIMYEYLAYVCATTGNLRSALAQSTIDDELLDTAGELLETLITGGPEEDINEYQDAAEVLASYLNHLETRTLQLKYFPPLQAIYTYLSDPEHHWKNREYTGLNKDIRTRLLGLAHRMLYDSQWKQLVSWKISTRDETEFYYVNRVAEFFRIDIWETHWKRLQEAPLDAGRWYPVMKNAKKNRIDEILQFAFTHLPLDAIATGPAEELGLGVEYQPHSCLGFILQYLGKYPGQGIPLIQTALQSPVTRNRTMALRALSQWETIHWGTDLTQALKQALKHEPKKDIRMQMKHLLHGK